MNRYTLTLLLLLLSSIGGPAAYSGMKGSCTPCTRPAAAQPPAEEAADEWLLAPSLFLL